MADFKHLISPFATHLHSQSHPLHSTMKVTPRPATPCNCDSDDEMAPECAFVCNRFKDTTKKRQSRPRVKTTRRRTQMKK